MDTITILHSPGHRLAKRVLANGTIQDFADAKWFDLHTEPVSDLDELEDLLQRLAPCSDCCVVRGEILDTSRTERVRRLLYEKDGHAATLKAASRRWLALDVDGTPRPDDVPAADLAACAALAIARLPEAFREASCVVQATSGHGIKAGCRLRLFYWLSEPLGAQALKAWLPTGCDQSVFNPAQPIFTATVLLVDREDHLPVRMLRLPGQAEVRVPPEIGAVGDSGLVSRAAPMTMSCVEVEAAERVAAAKALARGKLPFALRFKMQRVEMLLQDATLRCSVAPDGQKRNTLFRQARMLGGVLHTGFLTESEATEALWAAVAHRAKCEMTARETIAEGLAAGRAEPIQLPEPKFPMGRPKHPYVEMSGLLRRRG